MAPKGLRSGKLREGDHLPALSDLNGHGARHHISRCQVLGVGRIALHEALALTVYQDASLATAALGDQTTGSIDPWKNADVAITV